MNRLNTMARFAEPHPNDELVPVVSCACCGEDLYKGDSVITSVDSETYCSANCFAEMEGNIYEL